MTTATARTRRTGGAATAGLALVGAATVVVSFVAMFVAGLAVGDSFVPGADAVDRARDTGVFRAVSAWARPLALTGIALVFSGVFVALVAIRKTYLPGRRDALTHILPTVLARCR